MKKIFWLLVGLALLSGLGAVLRNTWQTAKYIQDHGREATLRIGKKYNSSRWASPLPIKQIHTYTAVLLPDIEALIESDQNLELGGEYFIQFLTRDIADEGRNLSLRPLVTTIRLKSEADGTPVRIADTDLMDRAVEKAMGPPAKGVYIAPRAVAEAAPDRIKPTVPFIFAGAKDGTLEVIWNNCSLGELFVLGAWILLCNMVLSHAWSVPLNPSRRTGSERADFVHPSQRRIDPERPAEDSQRLKFTPSPRNSDHGQAPPDHVTPLKRPSSIPIPARTTPTETPKHEVEDSRATTAPFVPAADAPEPTLKLKRRTPPPPSENENK